MKLSFLLSEERILVGITGGERSKKEILDQLLELLFKKTGLKDEGVTREELLADLISREQERTTGLGEEIAFPHARLAGIRNSYTLLGICPDGVEYQALDRKAVRFFVLSIVPIDKANLLLVTRAAIIRFLTAPSAREALLCAPDAFTVWQQIDKSGVAVDRNILARDIMRPHHGTVPAGASLRDAARALHQFHEDSLPIIDEHGVFKRDISCYDLFSSGLPDFFANLHTISFVRNMDPFEKYFQGNRDIPLEAMHSTREVPVIHADATLMEIVFEVATRNKPILYVVDENRKLLGIIDRFSIVDKILMGA